MIKGNQKVTQFSALCYWRLERFLSEDKDGFLDWLVKSFVDGKEAVSQGGAFMYDEPEWFDVKFIPILADLSPELLRFTQDGILRAIESSVPGRGNKIGFSILVNIAEAINTQEFEGKKPFPVKRTVGWLTHLSFK